ncbi:MAG: pirin family protein [Gammaproteobacteria bacterium]|nr:pirin family protein [Gammaproteobacteria bacterium]
MELRIEPQEKDLGEFTVRRVLPAARRRMIGPFIFFDHMGPAQFAPGKGIAVRPHPHIGLATLTYLFAGEIMHRDSLGFVQPIRPGAVNLMTAGRGIVHSERAGDDLDTESHLHGIQSWMALPDDKLEIDPAFEHYPADSLPEVAVGGVPVRVIMGTAYEQTSPVLQHSPTLYFEARLKQGQSLRLPREYAELGVYVVEGNVVIDAHDYGVGTLAVAAAGASITVEANADSRIMVLGGDPVGPRHIWWNFVAADRERMEQAKQDWRAGRFAAVPGDDEFIPLPD